MKDHTATTQTVKGMTNMKYIHSDFKTKKILRFIADLIVDYDYKSYDDLSDADKSMLTAYLIEAAGRSGETECIVESAHFDQTINLFKKSLIGTKEDDENFLEAIKSNAIDYYEHTMQALFDYVLTDYQTSRMEWLEDIAKYGNPDDIDENYRGQTV